MNPEKQQKRKRFFIIESIILYVLMLYAGLIVGNGMATAVIDPETGEKPNGINIAFDSLLSIQENPLKIFPTDLGCVLFFMLVAVLVWSFLWRNYAEMKNTMINEEYGTSGFETNMKNFYQMYLYDPQIIKKIKKFARTFFNEDEGALKMRAKRFSKKIVNLCRDNAAILSMTVYISLNAKFTQRNLNTFVLGGSGTGKSRFFVKPNILQANASYVVTDPSGDIMAETGTFLTKRKKYRLLCFNIQNMLKSHHYNPFAYIQKEEDIPKMINCLIANTDESKSVGGDPFWSKAEIALDTACCAYLFEARPLEERTFANVVKMLRMVKIDENGNSDEKNELDILFENWEAKYPSSYSVKCYKTFKMAPGKTALSILITAGVRLGLFFDLPEIANLTAYDEMHLERLGTEKTALFIVTPQGDTTYSFLASMLYTQIFETLYKVGEEQQSNGGSTAMKIPVRCLIDEFANVGKIPSFEIKLATMRKYNISACPVLQSMAQIKQMYEKEWEGLIGNCDETLFLGGTEASTLKELSEKIGDATINGHNWTLNKGEKQGGGSVSRSSQARTVMKADEIGRMKNSECIVFVRGRKAIKSHKYRYQKHPNYKYTSEVRKEDVYKFTPNSEGPVEEVVLNTDRKYVSSYVKKLIVSLPFRAGGIEFTKENSVVLNTVSSGSTAQDQILELSILDMEGNELYYNLFNPQMRLSEEIIKKTSLTNELLMKAPNFKDEWPRIKELLRNKKIVTLQQSGDRGNIEKTLNHYFYDENELDILFEKTISAIDISKQYIPGLEIYAANYICKNLNILDTESYRTHLDSLLTIKILYELSKIGGGINEEIKENTATEQRKESNKNVRTANSEETKTILEGMTGTQIKGANVSPADSEFDLNTTNIKFVTPTIANTRIKTTDEKMEYTEETEEELEDVNDVGGVYYQTDEGIVAKESLEEEMEGEEEYENDVEEPDDDNYSS